MEWGTRIALIDPYARIVITQTNTQVVQLTHLARLILLHLVRALGISVAVHPKQGNDRSRSNHDLP